MLENYLKLNDWLNVYAIATAEGITYSAYNTDPLIGYALVSLVIGKHLMKNIKEDMEDF